MAGASSVSTCFCVILCVGFCIGHFVMVFLNLTYLHSLQEPFYEHLFNLYYIKTLNYSIRVAISCWQRFHLVRFDLKIYGLITTCDDVWGGVLAAVMITKNMYCDQTFQDDTKTKNLFEYLIQYRRSFVKYYVVTRNKAWVVGIEGLVGAYACHKLYF